MFGSVVRIKVRIVQSRSKQFNVCEGVWGWDLDSGQSNQVEECLRVEKKPPPKERRCTLILLEVPVEGYCCTGLGAV